MTIAHTQRARMLPVTRVAVMIVPVLLSAGSAGCDRTPPARPTEVQTSGSDTIALPFSRGTTANRVIVNVSVNGLPELPFLLDTGAARTYLDLEHYGVISPKDAVAIKNGTSTLRDEAIVIVNSIAVGDVKAHNLVVCLRRMPPLDNGACGLLADDVLRNFIVTIDYRTSTLTLKRRVEP